MTSSITPAVLASLDSTSVWGGQEYRHRASVTNHEIYDLWNTGNVNWEYGDTGAYSIKVNTTTNTWSDYGSSYPFIVTENSDGTVSLSASDTGLLYKFTKPTTASWISTGGTSTEGVEVLGGSLTFSNGSVSYTINSDSPTTSSTQYYGIQENGNFIGATANGISHSNGTPTTGSVSGTVGTVYRLMHTNTGGGTTVLTELASLTATLGSKKVHCNFW